MDVDRRGGVRLGQAERGQQRTGQRVRQRPVHGLRDGVAGGPGDGGEQRHQVGGGVDVVRLHHHGAAGGRIVHSGTSSVPSGPGRGCASTRPGRFSVSAHHHGKTWLQAFARLSGQAAQRIVAAARLLRSLPKLAAVAQTGEASAEQVQQVARLAGQVGVHRVAEVDATLADAARTLDPARFGLVCARVQAHLDPDGQDPAADFDRRSLTIAPVQGMLVLRGQLDPEGGAAVATALDALTLPPADGDTRSAGQRRADALVELARRQLTAGTLPSVAGQRPQIGVLLHPQALSPGTLARLAEAHQADAAGQRLRQLATAGAQPSSDWTRPGAMVDQHERIPAGFGRTSQTLRLRIAPPAPATQPPRAGPPAPGPPEPEPGWQQPGWADPPWLNWIGPIPPATAQRVACDADIWRIIFDPTTGTPLDVGRRHRLVPHWIRRALHTRDRGCRWPGCPTPADWTDAHHLDPWADGGETSLQRCLLLCRHHHSLVHEAHWTIDLHPTTGHVTITRPEGIPYQPPHTHSSNWNGTTTQATS
ncbi:MAG: DUF222 domain-containing protein [Micromonosporaceae bacterium]|nr:DUF222 domain-containing protein [Micromonosporaceae bacterium]